MMLAIAMMAALASECEAPAAMCEAEVAVIAAEQELEITMAAAQRAAARERTEYQAWAQKSTVSTLDADELASLDTAQSLWRVSMEADCLLEATKFKTSAMSSVPHVELLKCQSERIAMRIEFLKSRYQLDEIAN